MLWSAVRYVNLKAARESDFVHSRHNILGKIMACTINLVKLSVGSESVASLQDWQSTRAAQAHDGLPRHITRMWPKRAQEIINGGSIYWVIKGLILCRQKVLRFDEITGPDGIRRCAIVYDPQLIKTVPTPKRPFQGWRYMQISDAPADLSRTKPTEDPLPPMLEAQLANIGVL